jgi:hypothetical protein
MYASATSVHNVRAAATAAAVAAAGDQMPAVAGAWQVRKVTHTYAYAGCT